MKRAASLSLSGVMKPILLAWVCLTFTCTLSLAQVVPGPEQVLYAFQGPAKDGGYPSSGLTMDSSGNLYGTTQFGGVVSAPCNPEYSPLGCGTVFELSPNGTGGWTETVLYNFLGGSDGQYPSSGLIFDQAGNLYGATQAGGASNNGTVFELSHGSGGWTETILYSFQGGTTDGASPQGNLIFDQSGNLYGTTSSGGNLSSDCDYFGGGSCGTVFKLSPNGSGGWTETVLFEFPGSYAPGSTTDGSSPNGGMVFDQAGNLYGTTQAGGSGPCTGADFGCGTVIELSHGVSGWTETVLYNFQGGSDGALPQAGLIFDQSGNLYGATQEGGQTSTGNPDCNNASPYPGCGTVFELSPNGGGWKETILHTFQMKNDGGYPSSGLIFDQKGNLYGTAGAGAGSSPADGMVFALSPKGSGGWAETILYNFQGGLDGSNPQGGVIFDQAGHLYGTTRNGGPSGCGTEGTCGTVFELFVGQDFSMAASSSSSATVMPGQTATYTVAVAPVGGFSQTVALSCSGAPAQSTCSVSPSSVKLSGSSPASVTVTVTTAGASASLANPAGLPRSGNRLALWLALPGLSGLVLLSGSVRCRRRVSGMLYVLALLCLLSVGITWSGCGGGSSSSGGGGGSGTQVGTYTITVTGAFTSGSTTLTHNTKLTLVVQ
jgi:uncharacterized repeat protein (TIGR03803 family)